MNTWTAPAQRIVSLLPSATEIVYALGLEGRLVGVTHECDFPPGASAKPHLTASSLPKASTSAQIDRHVRASLHAGSSLYALDSALLEALAPDLIITQELCAVCAVSYEIVARAAKQLRSDPRVVSLEPSSLEDVFANILTVGELAERSDAAASVVAHLRARAAQLCSHVEDRPHPRVLVLEWTDPPMSGGHWTPELVVLAGGEPVLGHPGANSTVLAWDAIADADPDVILVAPCGYDLAATSQDLARLADHATWKRLRAVRAGRAYAIDGNAYLNRPGPRLIDTAELFASAIYDERYGAARTDPNAMRQFSPSPSLS